MQHVIDYSDCVRMAPCAFTLNSISKVVELGEELLFKPFQLFLNISLCGAHRPRLSLSSNTRGDLDLRLREVLLVENQDLRH